MEKNVLKKKSNKELKQITDEVVERILDNGKLKISKIILYGSYARGTADEESDIDLMILCENSDDEAREFSKEIFHRADAVAYEHDIMIQTNVKNTDFFYKWVDALPYYRNVDQEGVVLYG